MNAAVAESEQRWQNREQELQTHVTELQSQLDELQVSLLHKLNPSAILVSVFNAIILYSKDLIIA